MAMRVEKVRELRHVAWRAKEMVCACSALRVPWFILK